MRRGRPRPNSPPRSPREGRGWIAWLAAGVVFGAAVLSGLFLAEVLAFVSAPDAFPSASGPAVFAGIALFFTRQNPGNLTYVLLCMLAVGNSFVISYTRARAHEAGGTCTVGYWQRGERMAAVLIATAAHNIPALVLQQALLTLPTVLRRIFHAKAVLEGKHPITDPRQGGWWLKVRLWRWPRMTIPYDLVTGLNIAWLIFARVPANDYLRWWVG